MTAGFPRGDEGKLPRDIPVVKCFFALISIKCCKLSSAQSFCQCSAGGQKVGVL